MQRASWLGPDPFAVAAEKFGAQWKTAQEQAAEAARAEKERLQKLRSGLRVGDAVKLSRNVSREILAAHDDEGCQIELDGVLHAIEGERGRVVVYLACKKLEQSRQSVSISARRREIERTVGVRVWSQKGARATKRQRDDTDARPAYWSEI